jgi:LysM repeat protein
VSDAAPHRRQVQDVHAPAAVEVVEGVSIDYARIPAVTMYMVQKGDTLWSIAKRYNTTVDALAKLNNIENPTKITKGMQIMILKSIRSGQ